MIKKKKKKKKMSKVEAAKTLVTENIKIMKLKSQIADRKQTNAAFKRMRSGNATVGDSSRLAQAMADHMNKTKKKN